MSHLRRRRFLLATGALLAAPLARAQQPQAVRRIGLLTGYPATLLGLERAFRRILSQIGYEEGKNLIIEWRFPASHIDELPRLAQELVDLRVELIVAVGNEAIMPASRATRTIPIVMWFGTHPVENGWVKSLARPGGNITGTVGGTPEHAGKVLEMLREAAPRAVRIAVMFNPTYPFAQTWLAGYDRGAKVLGMVLQYFPVTRPEEVGPALDRVAKARPDALFVSTEAILGAHARTIADFAIERKLMIVSNWATHVIEGGLLSLAPDPVSINRRTISYVDRILRGAKPADLPVELPTTYELVFNAKTARAIGYKIPPNLLARADRVIE